MRSCILLLLFGCSDSPTKAQKEGSGLGSPLIQNDQVLILGKAEVLLEEGGLRLDRFTWSIHGESGIAWRVRLPRAAWLDIVPSETVQPLDTIVSALPAPWAAVNGGFYEQGPMGLVISDGKTTHGPDPRGGSGILLAQPGPASIIHRDAWVEGPTEALQSVDRIVDGRKNLVARSEGAHRDARSAVALSKNNVWLVVAAADGSVTTTAEGVTLQRTAEQGLTLSEFGSLLVGTTGAETALNLDGAVSSQMIVVTSDKRWSIKGEKGTINAVVGRPSAPR